MAKGNVLPVRHLLVLQSTRTLKTVPAWVQDYALFLLDADGQIAAWYAGAERIYGYKSAEVIGKNMSTLLSGRRHAPRQAG